MTSQKSIEHSTTNTALTHNELINGGMVSVTAYVSLNSLSNKKDIDRANNTKSKRKSRENAQENKGVKQKSITIPNSDGARSLASDFADILNKNNKIAEKLATTKGIKDYQIKVLERCLSAIVKGGFGVVLLRILTIFIR